MKLKLEYAAIFYQFNGVCRNMDGNNPVHLAAINGYTNTMVAILSIHSHLVNAENRAGVRTNLLSGHWLCRLIPRITCSYEDSNCSTKQRTFQPLLTHQPKKSPPLCKQENFKRNWLQLAVTHQSAQIQRITPFLSEHSSTSGSGRGSRVSSDDVDDLWCRVQNESKRRTFLRHGH